MFGILDGLGKVVKSVVSIPVAAVVDLKDAFESNNHGKSESEKNLDRLSDGVSDIVDEMLDRKKK